MIEVGDVVQYIGPFRTGEVGEVVRIDGNLCEVEALCGQCWWAMDTQLKVVSLSLGDFKASTEIEQTYGGLDVGQMEPGSDEALLQQAIQVILRDKRPTISHLQRRLRVGYNKAAVLIEKLEERGVIGPQPHSGQRQILIDDDGNPIE